MPNILSSIETGKNSLIANQIGMDTTGHNISNVHTEGFSRQRAEMGTMHPDNIQPGQIGKGVRVKKVVRIYNSFIERTLRQERTGLAEWSEIADSQSLIEVSFNEPSEFGMNQRTADFFNAWQDLTEYPEDYGLRSLVKDAGIDFSETFNQLRSDLQDIRKDSDLKIINTVTRINEILQDITDLNKKIVSIEVAGNQPNDLKDRRDRLTTELAEYIDIDITEEASGLRITYGKYLLVEGNVSNLFSTQTNGLNDNLSDIIFAGGATLDFSGLAANRRGKIGALMQFRDTTITDYISSLTDFAVNLAHNVNDEHFDGFSYNGATTNQNFFALNDTNNSDTETHTARTGIIRVENMSNIQSGSHHLVISATGTMSANANGNLTINTGTIALNQAGAFTGSAVSDYYVSIVTPNAAANDLNALEVRLMRDGAQLGSSIILGAGAGPTNVVFGTYDGITFDADITAGTAVFIANERSDGYNPDAQASLDGGAAVAVIPNGNYAMTGGTNNGFTPGGTMDIIFGGAVTIGNDTITTYTTDSDLDVDGNIVTNVNNIAAAQGAGLAGDNTNALDIVNLQFQSLMNSNTRTLSQFYNALITSIGVDTKTAYRWKDNQSVIVDQLVEQREAFSGVNLDEELTYMLKFQRGFESASRFITTIDGMIDVIINRMGYVGR